MNLLFRLKPAFSVLLHGEARQKAVEIPPLTEEEVAQVKQFFPREKFFILGFARSGTTILMRLIGLHPRVYCSYQAHFFTRSNSLLNMASDPQVHRRLNARHNRWTHGRDPAPLMLRAAADMVMERDAQQAGKMIVGDKSPTATIHGQAVRDMRTIYPDAKLIYIYRDGRDVLVSERMRNFIENNRFLLPEDHKIMAALKKDPARFLNGDQSIFTEKFIRRVAGNWAADIQEIDQEARRLYPGAYLPVRYEDLLADAAPVIERVWEFLGADAVPGLRQEILNEMGQNQDEEWQAHKNETIASFLPKGQAGNWRERFSARDRQLFKEVAGDALVQWGYEKDLNW